MPQDDDPLDIIGQTIGEKYRIDSLAGDGGFSAVYRAQHLVWNEPVAIKFFTALGNTSDEVREKLLADFIQEGKLMTQLSSRSAAIVQARDIGRHVIDEKVWCPYMVLEWLEGEPLDRTLTRERGEQMPPRTLGEAVSLLDPVAEALTVAHRQNVAHRDLKPANVICLGDPRELGVSVKVLDFGIAKVMGEQIELQEQLKQTGQQITSFTPNYGAPEQFSRTYGATGPWTDVYAMALILVELMRGKRALDGQTVFDLGASSCHVEQRPTPRQLGIEVSDAVEAVFARALALAVDERHSNMADFWAELYAALGQTEPTWVGGAANTARKSLGSAPTHIGDTATSQKTGAAGPRASTLDAMANNLADGSKKKKPLLAALIAGVVVVSGVAFVVTRGGDTESDSAAAIGSPSELPSAAAPGLTVKSSDGAAEGSPAAAAETDAAATPSASASAAGSAAATEDGASKPVPAKAKRSRKRRRTKEKPSATPKASAAPKAPAPKTGGDAWDPSTFGGR